MTNRWQVYNATGETETFRFIEWTDFSTESVTLPIDKIAAQLIKEKLESDLIYQ
jgi:hypothetical protein